MLTWKEGYQAAYGFLDGIWDEMNGADQELLSELDTFLGGMLPQEDGSSADPAMEERWHEAVGQITHGDGWGDLTEEGAYQAMALFLERWAKDNSDGTILGICEDLAQTGAERDDWVNAVQKVLKGEFDPYFGLTAEGDPTETVRATLIYLVNGDLVLTKRPYTLKQELQAEYVGYQTSLSPMTYEELSGFFADDFGAEENWPIDPKDLREFFESDEETAWFADE